MTGGPPDRSLDQVSFLLGRNNEGLQNLNRLFEQHCTDDDTRHQQNVRLLEANTRATNDLAAAVKSLNDSVAFMRPVVDSYVVTRGRLALIASAGFGLVVVIGWLMEAGIKWLVAWVLSTKFGAAP